MCPLCHCVISHKDHGLDQIYAQRNKVFDLLYCVLEHLNGRVYGADMEQRISAGCTIPKEVG